LNYIIGDERITISVGYYIIGAYYIIGCNNSPGNTVHTITATARSLEWRPAANPCWCCDGQIDGCIVLNEHNTVFACNRSAMQQVFPWANPSPERKRYLNRFRRFCMAH